MFDKFISFFRPKPSLIHLKVLVIDDNEVDQRVACAAVEKGGFTALKAKDGKDGIETAKSQKPDLIILDYNLPDMKGFDICAVLKSIKETQDIPVLYLTSMNDPDSITKCFEQGENYLSKPISVKFLLKQIKSILNPKILQA